MVLKVLIEQRIFNTVKYTKNKGTIEYLNNFSLKMRTKNCEFSYYNFEKELNPCHKL